MDMADLRDSADPLLKEIQAEYLSHIVKTTLNAEERHIYEQYYIFGKTLHQIASDPVMKDSVNYSRIFHKKQNAIRKIQLKIWADAIEEGHTLLAKNIKKGLKKKL